MAKTALAKTFAPPSSADNLPAVLQEVETALSTVRTVEDALDSNTMTLGRFSRENGEQAALRLIMAYLIRLTDLVNVKRPLTETQICAIAAEVKDIYGWMTVADLHLIFKRAARGEWGEMYENTDMPKVMGWFRRYAEERVRAAMDRNDRQAQRNRYSDDDNRQGDLQSFRQTVKALKF